MVDGLPTRREFARDLLRSFLMWGLVFWAFTVPFLGHAHDLGRWVWP